MIIEFIVEQDYIQCEMAALADEISGEDKAVRVIRLLGSTPNVELPMYIGGYKVCTIGKYCFSENAHLSHDNENVINIYLNNHRGLREIAGGYIEKIGLPDSVKEVENYAFYNCRSMRELTVGKSLTLVGTDAFMNCKSLKRLSIRAGASEQTGVVSCLKQLNKEIETAFIKDNAIEALFFYPEYSEIFEEIGPAHIFELNMQGEGYRARQMFNDRVVDAAGYDKIFAAATALENVTTLAYMAIDRLRYEYNVSEEADRLYRRYVTDNSADIMRHLVKEEDLDNIGFLCREKLVTREGYAEALKCTTKAGWTIGSAEIIKLRNDNIADRVDEYIF